MGVIRSPLTSPDPLGRLENQPPESSKSQGRWILIIPDHLGGYTPENQRMEPVVIPPWFQGEFLVLQTTDFWFQSHVSWLRGEVFLFQRFQMALGSSKKNWGGIRSLPPLNHWIVSKSWDPILHLPLTSPIVFGGKDWFASLLGLSSWYISPTRQGAPGS